MRTGSARRCSGSASISGPAVQRSTPTRSWSPRRASTLRATDGKDRSSICVGFDRLRGDDCTIAPVDARYFSLERSGAAVGGVLSGDVATVRFDLDSGKPLVVDTTPGDAVLRALVFDSRPPKPFPRAPAAAHAPLSRAAVWLGRPVFPLLAEADYQPQADVEL